MSRYIYLLFLSCIYLLIRSSFGRVKGDISTPVVTIDNGQIQGTVKLSRKERHYNAFVGIPYAQPPVGHLRFEAAKPHKPWDDILIANTEGPPCMQLDFNQNQEVIGSEDCLFLNIFTPKLPEENKPNPNLAVMVWIHGGGFNYGSSSLGLYGPEYFMDQDVVVVTFNYRVGVLGFYSTTDDACPGNYGLKDQQTVLKWVSDNIHAFGGNNRRVTLFGQDAGGASVHYHMLSPHSQGLFHRAISQSGVANNHWSFVENNVNQARRTKLAHLLSCPPYPSEKLINCIKLKDAEVVVNATRSFIEFPGIPITVFGPVMERKGNYQFISDEPLVLMQAKDWARVPWMIGFTQNEGGIATANILRNIDSTILLRDFPVQALYKLLEFEYSTWEKDKIAKQAHELYFNKNVIDQTKLKELGDINSDRHYLSGIYEALQMYTQVSRFPVFWYRFSHEGQMSVLDQRLRNGVSEGDSNSTTLNYAVGKGMLDWIRNLKKVLGDWMNELKIGRLGVCHSDDLFYLFQAPAYESMSDAQDVAMSELMVKLWTTFALTGNPTTNKETLGFRWTPVNQRHNKYLDLNLNPEMKDEFPLVGVNFWNSLLIHESGRKKILKRRRDEL